MRKLIVKIAYARWAFKRINHPHLGDIVNYKNKRCWLIQGVANPKWDLQNIETQEIYKNVYVSDFELDKSFKRKWWAFQSSYRFKMQSWFLIDTWHKSIFAPVSNVG